MTFPHPADHPLALPHLGRENGRFTFLGAEIDGELFGPLQEALWRRCDGSRPMTGFSAEEQRTITRWHEAGMVLLAPAPADPAGRRPPGPPGPSGPVVVSPHPDDAQLALGGWLARDGGHVVDVFSTEVWTVRRPYQDRPELTSRLIVAEEHVACRVLGVSVELLGFLDAAERPAWKQGFFTAGEDDLEPARREPELLEEVTARLAATLPSDRLVLAPLAVGGHADHVLCREAALRLLADGVLAPGRLAFYADMPYSLFDDPEKSVHTLSERLASRGLAPPRAQDVRLEAAHGDRKREALRSYRLQLNDGHLRRVDRHGRRLGAERGHAFAERVWRV